MVPRLIPLLLALAVALLPGHALAQTEGPSRFLWVECEGSGRTLDSLQSLQTLLDDAQAWGIDQLFVQVYRGDRAWFASLLSDDSPYQNFLAREQTDMLAHLIEAAHARGIEVHAWVNTFRIGKDRQANIVKKLGQDIITRDNRGRSMVDYPGLDLPETEREFYEADRTGYWLEPGDERVQDYLLAVLEELTQRYPGLDGLHLDFIRLPYVVPFSPGARFPKGISYGYGVASVRRFAEQRGWDPLRWDGSTDAAQAWDQWRRDQITGFVAKAKELLGRRLPQARLSVAAICWGDRAYLTAFQDWRGWLEQGLVDFVAIMNYGLDPALAGQVTRSALAFSGNRPVWVGLGAYLFAARKAVFQEQIEDTLRQLQGKPAGGMGFFSYDSLKKTPALIEMIASDG